MRLDSCLGPRPPFAQPVLMLLPKFVAPIRRKALIKSDIELKEPRVLNESEVCADAVRALLSVLPSLQLTLKVLHSLIEIRRPLVGENKSSGLILGGGKRDTLMLSSVEF